ncbi:hypothetical protein [Calothrix sp. PCC 6303]|nr:hypothetical protein [Calothrix sp. PCC 6303]
MAKRKRFTDAIAHSRPVRIGNAIAITVLVRMGSAIEQHRLHLV